MISKADLYNFSQAYIRRTVAEMLLGELRVAVLEWPASLFLREMMGVERRPDDCRRSQCVPGLNGCVFNSTAVPVV